MGPQLFARIIRDKVVEKQGKESKKQGTENSRLLFLAQTIPHGSHEVMLLVKVSYALPHWVLGEEPLQYLEKKIF